MKRHRYDRLGVMGIVAMLVHATGAPAFSAASSDCSRQMLDALVRI